MPRSAKAGATPKSATEETIQSQVRAIASRYREHLPWADTDAIEATLSLLRANRRLQMATSRIIDSLELGVSLSDARFSLLCTLHFSEDTRLPQNELSRTMGVSRTNITNLIDGLERDSLVVRIGSPEDRRVSYAQLTPAGEQLCASLLPLMARIMAEACRRLDRDDKRRFARLLSCFATDLSPASLPDELLQPERSAGEPSAQA